MRAYYAILSARFRVLLQYRAAAIAGVVTQTFFGLIIVMVMRTFYASRTGVDHQMTIAEVVSYVFHIENPVRFQKEIKVTMEHGHGNHLANEMSSVAYWYADKPYAAAKVPPVAKRQIVRRDNTGEWLYDKKNQTTSHVIKSNREMKAMKAKWAKNR